MTTATAPSPTAPPMDETITEIAPKRGWQAIHLGELWHYRELLWILAMRDVRVRYKQTALGAAWAIIPSLLTMIAFTIIQQIGNLGRGDSIPAPVSNLCLLLPWQLFASSISASGNSLVNNQHLITKVYFPRLVMPVASVMTALVDFAISFLLLLALMLWYHVAPPPQVVLMPVFVGLAFFAAVSVGLWLSALNVEYRDIRFVIPFMIQFGLYCTPILLPPEKLTHAWMRVVLALNPMSGIMDGFRWCMLGAPTPGPMLLVSVLMVVVLLIGGLFYFRRMEKTFADLV